MQVQKIPRTFRDIIPGQGANLYAIANDGTAWVYHPTHDGWAQLDPLPDREVEVVKTTFDLGTGPSTTTETRHNRYTVMPKSQSAHCCFDATVVDTTKPHMIGGEHYRDSAGFLHYEAVCECFDIEDANRIAAALNENEHLVKTLRWIERTMLEAYDGGVEVYDKDGVGVRKTVNDTLTKYPKEPT